MFMNKAYAGLSRFSEEQLTVLQQAWRVYFSQLLEKTA
jgi:hypothetical protein